jgi:hypothetical protein
MEQNKDVTIIFHPTIAPHTYPLWIKFSFTLCCILFFVCLFNFPYYFILNNKVKKARNAFDNKNYADASIYYKELSILLPTNKYVKLCLAESLFKSEHMKDHMTALNYLAKIEINKKEWNELLHYMPVQYAECFQDVKKDRS